MPAKAWGCDSTYLFLVGALIADCGNFYILNRKFKDGEREVYDDE